MSNRTNRNPPVPRALAGLLLSLCIALPTPAIAEGEAASLLNATWTRTACEPQDPVRVAVGETVFAIPAVLMPTLYPIEGVDLARYSQSLSGKVRYSVRGTPLMWGYCKNEANAPIKSNGISIKSRWISYAVEHGEMDYEFLPFVGSISVNKGHLPPPAAQNTAKFEYFSGISQAWCGEALTLPKTGPNEVTSRQCLGRDVNLSSDTVVRLSFSIKESAGFPTRNDPADWPAIAREVEHLIQSMMVSAE